MIFNTTNELRIAVLTEGMRVSTLGYFEIGDGGAGEYIITQNPSFTPDDLGDLRIAAGMTAVLQPDQFSGGVHANQYGALGISNDDSPALNAAFEKWDTVTLGRYHRVEDTVYVGKNKHIITTGDSVIDGEHFEMKSIVVMSVGSDVVTPMNIGLASFARAGEITVAFDQEHNLNIGDVFCMYNPADYSFSPARDYYRNGEFCKVNSIISPTEVRLDQVLRSSHDPSSSDQYLMDMSGFTLTGSLTVKCTYNASLAMRAIDLIQLLDCSVANITATAYRKGYTGLTLRRCYNVSATELFCAQSELTGYNGDYGCVIANCQDVMVEGFFTAARHGVTTGGYADPCSVPNRDIHVKGIIKTSGEGNTFAFTHHGNIAGALVEGTMVGGYSFAGVNTKVRGIVYATESGIGIYAAEILDWNHDCSGVTIHSLKEPATGHAVIDIGANSNHEVLSVGGGHLNLSNMNIVCLGEHIDSIKIVQRKESLNSPVSIDLSNTRIQNKLGTTDDLSVYITSITTHSFSNINLSGMVIPENLKYVYLNEVEQWQMFKVTKEAELTTVIDDDTVEIAVSFDSQLPQINSLPAPLHIHGNTVVGGRTVIAYLRDPDYFGATVGIKSIDGTFTSSQSTKVTLST